MMSFLSMALLFAIDGGTPEKRVPAAPTNDDSELIEHLELLESLDEATDLELLSELDDERT